MISNALIDAIGTLHKPATGSVRIVSLVPSLTELLFTLELGDVVVGRTSYCVHPRPAIDVVPSVGGTKKVKMRLVRDLAPTHVLLNIDENTKVMAQQLAEFVPNLIVTHPLAPTDNAQLYGLLGGIFDRRELALALTRKLENQLAKLREATWRWPRQSVLYLIWYKPWMTVSRTTYISRTLALVGWDTLPSTAEQRYPIIDMTTQLMARPEHVLFSTEPYSFSSRDIDSFAATYHYPLDKLALIDGELVSWYGSRAIAALDYLYRFAASRRQHG